MIIDGKLKVNNVPKATIEKSLETNKFDKRDNSYSYLLSMPIHTLTKEKYQELLNEVKDVKAELALTKKLTTKEMYVTDLKELKAAIK
jgi:predicted transcriptional regulator